MDNGFTITHFMDYPTAEKNYFLHNHNNIYEILLFIKGDCEFRVEGNLYKLKPYDIIVTSNNELHRIVQLSPQIYERYVIYINTDFFAKNNCPQFDNIFKNRELGINNHIDSEIILELGIDKVIKKIYDYTVSGEETVAKCVLIELLYLLNKSAHSLVQENYSSKYIRHIISHINDNLTGDLSLDKLASQFHLSQSHLSRLFKSNMNMPIKKYITYKRLILARELYLNGMSLLDASMEAGFSNYSNFYRMYVKEFHNSPKNDLKF